MKLIKNDQLIQDKHYFIYNKRSAYVAIGALKDKQTQGSLKYAETWVMTLSVNRMEGLKIAVEEVETEPDMDLLPLDVVYELTDEETLMYVVTGEL